MKLKKRSARSRLRGARTCGYGARKKHRGKGSRGGKGMAGTGKRAGQKITYLLRYYGKGYLGKRGFKSRKKIKEAKIPYINLETLAYKYYNSPEQKISLDNYKVLAGNDVDEKLLEKLKGKELSCYSISDKARALLESHGVKVIVKGKAGKAAEAATSDEEEAKEGEGG
ncbi:MAG: uL15 family ribosomal protein [Candidatus Pacearchaeota archaeon]